MRNLETYSTLLRIPSQETTPLIYYAHKSALSGIDNIQHGRPMGKMSIEPLRQYQELRISYLKGQRNKALFYTIFSGICIFPLCFTISAYRNMAKKHERVINLLNKTLNLIAEINTKNEFPFDDNPDHLKNQYKIYAKELLDCGQIELALEYFKQVPNTWNYYHEAMIEATNILLMMGKYEEAIEYARRSNDSEYIRVVTNLKDNSDVAAPLQLSKSHVTTFSAPTSANADNSAEISSKQIFHGNSAS